MLIEHLSRQLHERALQGLTRRRVVAEGPCAPHQSLRAPGQPARDWLAFASNDYLGLAAHPALAAALAEGAARFGTGAGASSLISGHSQAHEALEDWLAQWLAPCVPGARALTFGSGYQANLALLTALGEARSTTLYTDRLNHASLIDGALLARAEVRRYPHADAARLGALLASTEGDGLKLIVTDAVFSMDGNLAPLPELLRLAETHDAWLIVDDAHGLGVLGPGGRGSVAAAGLCSERLILMGTLGKAAGVAGAFVAAAPAIIEWLVQTARPYIYTTATPPALAFATLASLRLIDGDEGEQRRAQLQRLIARLRDGLAGLIDTHPALGWRLPASSTAIQPLIVGDNHRALALMQALQAQGLWVPAIRPPTVPEGTARLRISLSAAHSEADIDALLAALGQAAKEQGA
ncbi:MAG: 8-amino-7-oxononanoate synthase [Burkholderiales bacterium]